MSTQGMPNPFIDVPIPPSIPLGNPQVSLCARCGSLVYPNNEARQAHIDFHAEMDSK
jgi:hypothetical protein